MSESKGHSLQMVIVPEIICSEPGNLRPIAAFSQVHLKPQYIWGHLARIRSSSSLIEKDLNGIPTSHSKIYHAQAQSLEPPF